MNPIFNEKRLEEISAQHGEETMTVSGAINRAVMLTLICAMSAAFSWGYAPHFAGLLMPMMIGAGLIGLGLVLTATFSPKTSPVVAPIYAVVQGAFLGVISAFFNQTSNGIVLQAVLLTFGILLGMLGLYQTRIIRVTARFRAIVVSATVGVMLFYLVAMGLRMFGISIPMMHDASWMGIGFSLFVIGLAAFNFLLDFDLMERLPETGAPKYYEWYCGLGFLVTLVWLYLEVLRLLARRD